jgi:hypothetical protein
MWLNKPSRLLRKTFDSEPREIDIPSRSFAIEHYLLIVSHIHGATARERRFVMEVNESDGRTRKPRVSNFVFASSCCGVKPHHMQDNLCLSITFNFSWGSLTRSAGLLLRPMVYGVFLVSHSLSVGSIRAQTICLREAKTKKNLEKKLDKHLWLAFQISFKIEKTFTLLPLVVCPQIIEENGRATIGYPFGFIYCTRIKYQVSRGFRAFQMLFFGDSLGDKNSHQVVEGRES